MGAQSMDAQYISQDENAPFTLLRAAEAGVLYHRQSSGLDLSGRAVAYYTHVDRDLLFNPQLGRLAQATGTTRMGFVGVLRATTPWLDELASVTYAHATFDDDGTLVPYVPIWIARSDTAFIHALPWVRFWDSVLVGSAGLGLNYIGSRALPFSQFAAPTFEVDASANVSWKWFTVGFRVNNLTDARYPLSQFFYASDFHSRDYPTLVPAAHFTAAAPRTFLVTFSLTLDRGEQ
jgi:outer membrane receptor protein involved in Fe transport